MELIHVIGGIDAICLAEGAEHLHGQLHIDHVDDLVALLTELAARYLHHDGVPLAGGGMAKRRGDKIILKGIVRKCSVGLCTMV